MHSWLDDLVYWFLANKIICSFQIKPKLLFDWSRFQQYRKSYNIVSFIAIEKENVIYKELLPTKKKINDLFFIWVIQYMKTVGAKNSFFFSFKRKKNAQLCRRSFIFFFLLVVSCDDRYWHHYQVAAFCPLKRFVD